MFDFDIILSAIVFLPYNLNLLVIQRPKHCSQERITLPLKICALSNQSDFQAFCHILNMPTSTKFYNKFGTRWRHHQFCLKLESFLEKNSRWFETHFLTKYGPKMPKTQTILHQLLHKKMLQNNFFGQCSEKHLQLQLRFTQQLL